MCLAPKGLAKPSIILVDSSSPDINSFPIDTELTNGRKFNFAAKLIADRNPSTCPPVTLPDCNAASASKVKNKKEVYIRDPYVVR